MIEERRVNGSGGSGMGRHYGVSQVDAIDPSSRRRIPFESHDGVAQRKDLALPNAPLLVPALVAHWTFRPASVSLATFQNHLHALHPGEAPLEIRVESRVVGAHHDEQLGIRK